MEGVDMMKRTMLAAGIVLALVAVGCSSDDSSSGDGASSGGGSAGTSVDVDLKDFAITPDTTSIAAGSVTFDAHNSGPSEHELVVLKTDLAADALPETEEGRVDEEGEGVEMIGEIEEFASGLDESATFDLAAGNYVLVCNIPGHYLSGMTIAVTVA
jgi:uncharacterized cupredoxin-like copper-binding protein